MTRFLKTSLALFAVTALTSGCAGEWSADAYAPADYKSTYKKITEKCEVSKSHGNKYVLTYISADAHDAWKSKKPLPKGAVLIKVGYPDSACSEPSEHWTMKKVAETGDIKDWNWQTLDEYGDVTNQDQSAMGGCTGCHTNYKAGDFVGTPAPGTK